MELACPFWSRHRPAGPAVTIGFAAIYQLESNVLSFWYQNRASAEPAGCLVSKGYGNEKGHWNDPVALLRALPWRMHGPHDWSVPRLRLPGDDHRGNQRAQRSPERETVDGHGKKRACPRFRRSRRQLIGPFRSWVLQPPSASKGSDKTLVTDRTPGRLQPGACNDAASASDQRQPSLAGSQT